MQHLEVSCAVRRIYTSLSAKGLTNSFAERYSDFLKGTQGEKIILTDECEHSKAVSFLIKQPNTRKFQVFGTEDIAKLYAILKIR